MIIQARHLGRALPLLEGVLSGVGRVRFEAEAGIDDGLIDRPVAPHVIASAVRT